MTNNYAKISVVESEEACTFEEVSIVCHSPVSTSSSVFSASDKSAAMCVYEGAFIGNQHYDLLNDELLRAISANNLDKVMRLLEKEVTPNATRIGSQLSALHLAALEGLDQVLDVLLSAGACPERTDRRGMSPLHLATWAGHEACVELLVRRCPVLVSMTVGDDRAKSADRKWMDIHDKYQSDIKYKLPRLAPGSSALHVASQWVRLGCATLLLKAGADVTATDDSGMNPLDVTGEAVFLQDADKERITGESFMEVFQSLFNTGAVPTSRLDVRQSPLHVAVTLKSRGTLDKLLSRDLYGGARVDTRNSQGERPLDLAIKKKWRQGVVMLLNAGADVTAKRSAKNVFHLAAEVGDEDIMRELLKSPLALRIINGRDGNVAPALFHAIRGGHLACVALLLDSQADVAKQDTCKRTVLHCACEHNQPRIIKVLFEKHFKSMVRMINYIAEGDCVRGTALHFAAHYGHTDCVEILVKQKCNLKIVANLSKFPYTALQLACNSGHVGVTKILLDADVTLMDAETPDDQLTSLHLACQSGHDQCVEVLVKAGADLSALCKDKEGKPKSALDLLVSRINSPVELMTKILDSCITYSKNSNGSRCIDVDYKILLPDKIRTGDTISGKNVNTSQLHIIDALLKTGHRLGQRDLLTHPLIESFLRLQWNKLSAFYYVMIAMYMIFVFSFTCVALLIFTEILSSSPWFRTFSVFAHFCYILTIVTLPVLLHFEVAQFCAIGIKYLQQIESWVKLVCYVLYPCSIAPVTIYYYEGIKKEMSDWTYQVGAVAVLLGWLELMLLLSRVPKYGYFVQIFIRVARSFVKVFGSFICFIIGFMLAFFIAFKGKSHFRNIFDSFMKTIVMMTSEYDYDNLFDKYVKEEKDDYDIFPFLKKEVKYDSYASSHVVFMKMIFLVFLLFVGIVLTNVMVAVAVDDVKDLNNLGKIDSLHRQARFLSTLESIYSFKLCCVFCLPYKFIRPISPHFILNIEDHSLNGVAFSERLIRAIMAKAEANKKQVTQTKQCRI